MALADKLKTTRLTGDYRSPVIVSVGTQIFTLIFTSLLFDFGVSFTIAAVALIPFWVAVLMITSRRPMKPTRFDRQFVAYGYLVLVFSLIVLNAAAGG